MTDQRQALFLFQQSSLILVGKRYAGARPLESTHSLNGTVGSSQTVDLLAVLPAFPQVFLIRRITEIPRDRAAVAVGSCRTLCRTAVGPAINHVSLCFSFCLDPQDHSPFLITLSGFFLIILLISLILPIGVDPALHS